MKRRLRLLLASIVILIPLSLFSRNSLGSFFSDEDSYIDPQQLAQMIAEAVAAAYTNECEGEVDLTVEPTHETSPDGITETYGIRVSRPDREAIAVIDAQIVMGDEEYTPIDGAQCTGYDEELGYSTCSFGELEGNEQIFLTLMTTDEEDFCITSDTVDFAPDPDCEAGTALDEETGGCVAVPDESDVDGDGFSDEEDNCPAEANPNQQDIDDDGVGDACDNCIYTENADQTDSDENGRGDLCEIDTDNDGYPDPIDECPEDFNLLSDGSDCPGTDGDADADPAWVSSDSGGKGCSLGGPVAVNTFSHLFWLAGLVLLGIRRFSA